MRLWPSEVYEHYLTHPRDLNLLWGYGPWLAEQRKQADKKRKAN
jgi:hypothetical protein